MGRFLAMWGSALFDSDMEVSHAIAEASRGRGYGSEALLCACRWAAENFDLAKVLAITESENAPSRRTLERAAFVHAADELMRFQGRQQTVSRYLWHHTNAPAR